MGIKEELKSEDQIKHCRVCSEDINWTNTATEGGWAEVGITCTCEKCFDNLTFDMEENIEELSYNIKKLVQESPSVVLAGGALRMLVDPCNEEICDYDLFVTDQSVLEKLLADIQALGYTKVFECPKRELFTFVMGDEYKIQVINKRPYKDCNDMLSSFDITACCAAWDGENFYKHERFVFDVLNKRINLNAVEYPNATLKRIVKYVLKGYTLTPHANNFFISSVNQMELTEENRVMYVD